MQANNLQPLLALLDYQFNNLNLLNNALTHRSRSEKNNERLEFLGDSVLNFVVAEALYNIYQDSSEGELSRLRSYLVKGEMLAKISRDMNLGDYVHLGQGELKSGGFRRDSILADCFEAMIAAVYLDGGFEACKKVILKIYKQRLRDKSIFEDLKDPKTLLQEWLQSRKIGLPNYTLVQITGEQHNQKFEVLCEVKAKSKPALKATGVSTTRRKAEKVAAREMLSLLSAKH